MPLHVPDLAIGLATVLGLLAVTWFLHKQRDVTLGHLRRLLIVTMVFYAARNVDWMTGSAVARSFVIASAALLPLMVLLATEVLLRRHAPKGIKVFVAGGGFGLILFAIIPSIHRSDLFILALILYQIASLSAAIWLVLARDRNSLSKAENKTVNRICIGLLILLPFLVSDYRYPDWPIPASMSGIAVLVVCWVLVHTGDREFHLHRMIAELLLLSGFSALAAYYVVRHLGADHFEGLQTWVMLFALTLAAAVIVGCQRLQWRSATRASITRGLQTLGDAESYLADLQAGGLAERILGPDLLADFDSTALIAAFQENGSASLSDLPKDPATDTMGQSQLRALLTRSGASQAYLAAAKPLRIAVGQGHGMAGGADPDLLAAFGLSRLMAERDVKVQR